MNNRFKFRIAVYERQQNNMPWTFVEYIDPDNQHWGLNQCGDIISDSSYSAHYTRKNAPDLVHRVYEPEMCTGFSDKNGNLIYEGDIVEITIFGSVGPNGGYVDLDEIYKGTVVWDRDCFLVKAGTDMLLFPHSEDCAEIVGNVHEKAEQKDK